MVKSSGTRNMSFSPTTHPFGEDELLPRTIAKETKNAKSSSNGLSGYWESDPASLAPHASVLPLHYSPLDFASYMYLNEQTRRITSNFLSGRGVTVTCTIRVRVTPGSNPGGPTKSLTKEINLMEHPSHMNHSTNTKRSIHKYISRP